MNKTVTIALPAGPEDDLAWEQELDCAKQAVSTGKNILWEIHWGKYTGRLTDEAVLASQMAALQEWTTRFVPSFIESTYGVNIYQGSICPALNEEGMERYYPWLDGRDDIPLYRRLYSSTLLFEYLHRLGSILPDTVPLYARLDVSSIGTLAEQAFLISSAAPLRLFLEGAKIARECDAAKGVCLPAEEHYSEAAVEKLDELLHSLHEAGHTYRLLPEKLLNEQWDGLDQLYLLETFLTKQGRRMLQGFAAAGGEIISR